MKVINQIENEQYTLEVIECDCGFHIGLDATYIDQVSDIEIKCPSCKKMIKTNELIE